MQRIRPTSEAARKANQEYRKDFAEMQKKASRANPPMGGDTRKLLRHESPKKARPRKPRKQVVIFKKSEG